MALLNYLPEAILKFFEMDPWPLESGAWASRKGCVWCDNLRRNWMFPEIEVPLNHLFKWDFLIETVHFGDPPFMEITNLGQWISEANLLTSPGGMPCFVPAAFATRCQYKFPWIFFFAHLFSRKIMIHVIYHLASSYIILNHHTSSKIIIHHHASS